MIEKIRDIKQPITRIVIGFFLFILVAMLVVTLIPGDAETSLVQMLTGQDSMSAGKIGEENIPTDYFQASRKECYYRYKQFGDMANDASFLNNCAYTNIRNLKATKSLSRSLGFTVSENSVNEEIYEQAKSIHSQTKGSAGYSQSEMKSVEDLYREMKRQSTINYLIDTRTMGRLYEKFLLTDLKKSEDELKWEKEASTTKISLKYVSFTDIEILKTLENSMKITDDEAKKEYDKELQEGKLPKDSTGNVESFEKRKSIIMGKLKNEMTQKRLSDIKTEVQNLKNSGKMDEMAKVTGTKLLDTTELSIRSKFAEADPKTKSELDLKLGNNTKFLKDVIDPNNQNKILGPYTDGDKIVYVQIYNISIAGGTQPSDSTKNEVSVVSQMENKFLVYTFLTELSQSLNNSFSITKKFDKAEQ